MELNSHDDGPSPSTDRRGGGNRSRKLLGETLPDETKRTLDGNGTGSKILV